MKTSIGFMIGAMVLCGCTGFKSKQRHTNDVTRIYDLDDKGRTNRVTVTERVETTTDASARAVVAAKGSLEGYRASNSDKAQTASIKSAEGESDASKMAAAIGSAAESFATLAAAIRSGGAPAARPVRDDPSVTRFVIPDGYELAPVKPAPTNAVIAR